MSKYNFTHAKKYAIYTTHGEKCYLCKKPIDLKSMHDDHIIPETLLEKVEELNIVLNSLGLPFDFEVNSYENWMPACAPCNVFKSSKIFEPTPLIQIILQNAKSKADKAKSLAEKTVSKTLISRALNTLSRAKESCDLTPEDLEQLQPLVEYHSQERNLDLRGTPIKLTALYEVISESNGIKTIKGPYGIGARPSRNNVDGSFNCPNCGIAWAWHGARCVICGMMDDD